MIIKLKRSARHGDTVKVYGTVHRKGKSEHKVVYIRSKNFRGWLCDCENFLFDRFAKNRNCEHLKGARKQSGRYGQKVGVR